WAGASSRPPGFTSPRGLDVAPTPASSLEVEDALLRVGERLGLKVMLLRLVAAELPDNPWMLDLSLEDEADLVRARTSHLCGSSCQASRSGCLTAFKVEDVVSKRTGRVMAIEHVSATGPSASPSCCGRSPQAVTIKLAAGACPSMEAIRTVPVDAKPPRGFDATLFDLLPDAVLYATCPGFAVRDANAACLRLFGLTRAQLLAGAGPDLGLGEDQLAALLRGEPVSLERTLRLGEGAALPAHLTLTPTGPFKGEPVGVVIVVRDLAERKRFEAVLQNAPAQILTIDRKGRILTLNRSVRGAEAAGLVGIDAYSTVAEEDRERVRALVEGAMLTGQPVEYE